MSRFRSSIKDTYASLENEYNAFDKWIRQRYWHDHIFLNPLFNNNNHSSIESHYFVNSNDDTLKKCKNILEIGFGKGEHIVELLKYNLNIKLLAVDPFYEGFHSLYKNLATQNLNHRLWLYHGYFHQIPFIYKPQIDEIYALFLDPWPKAGHEKRRLFQLWVIHMMWVLLHSGGKIYMAHDDMFFIQWTVQQFQKSTEFTINKWNTESLYTRYLEKARKQGKSIYGYTFQKK